MLTLLAYLVLGAGAGVIAGLLGLGGGIIIVPALYYLFSLQDISDQVIMHMAVATSLATICLTSVSSAWAHHCRGAVIWSIVKLLVPGIITGAILGAVIADYLPGDQMRIFFGIFECLVALQIGLELKPDSSRQLPGKFGMYSTGGIIGSMSAILGIGGGTLTVPFLVWCNVNIKNAVAISSACGFPIALAGAIAMIITGLDNNHLPENSMGYVYWPAALCIVVASVLTAPLGAWLAHVMPVSLLKKVFAVILGIIGLRMLF